MSNIKKISNYIIRKSNKLVNARSNFTLTQWRIVLLALAHFNMRNKKEQEELTWFDIPIREVLGLKSTKKVRGAQYKQVKQAAIDITQTALFIKKEGKWRSLPFIQAEGNDYEGVVRVKFLEEAKEHIANFSGEYTEYLYKNVYKFRCAHSFKIYELMIQYYPNITKREITVEELRQQLQLEKKYPEFYDFRKYVVQKAVDEINEHSDLFLSYDYDKKGSKARKFIFSIQSNPNYRPLKLEAEEKVLDIEHEEVVEAEDPKALTIEKKQLTEDFIAELSQEFDPEYVAFSAAQLEMQKNIRNPKGFLYKALLEGYYKESFERAKTKHKQDQQEKQRKKEVQQKKQLLEEIRQAYTDYYKVLMSRYAAQISNDDIQEFLFEHRKVDHPVTRKYIEEIRQGQPSYHAQNMLTRWFIGQYGDQEGQLMLDIANFARHKYQADWAELNQ
jgi:plasmid replication initiation protein